MIAMTTEEIRNACGGRLTGDGTAVITDITTDSRKAASGSLFAAIAGEHTDGHRYMEKAQELGAAAVLCERQPENLDIPYILTDSTLGALQDIAASVRQKAAIPVVGIGGSVGKTSTKEVVASVLAQKYRTMKTEGNFNNELGVPLTLFRLTKETEAAVVEMGIDDFGQMHALARIVRPDICILTNIGDCHLENLGDRDGVLKAKSEMFDYLPPDGAVILNGDDAHLSGLRDIHGIRPCFYGLDPKNDIWADGIENAGLAGTYCTIHTRTDAFRVLVPKPGVHMVYNAMAAAAAGLVLGLSTGQIRAGIESQESVKGRFHIYDENGIRIIDDCYNANPMSMKASLEALSMADGRKVAVLGDMGELGAEEEMLHREVGRFAAGLHLDALYGIGSRSRFIAGEARKDPDLTVRVYDRIEAFEQELPSLIRPGDTVLVKASHFMEFDRVVAAVRSFAAERV